MTERKVKTWMEFVIAAKALDTCRLMENGDDGLHTPTTSVRVEGITIAVYHDNGDEWTYGDCTLQKVCGQKDVRVCQVHNRNELWFDILKDDVLPFDEALQMLREYAITEDRIKTHYTHLAEELRECEFYDEAYLEGKGWDLRKLKELGEGSY